MTTEEKVIKIIKANLEKKAVIKIDTDLRKDLGLDSFAMLMIVNALEDEYGISIDDQHYQKITTVADIVKSLKSHCPNLKES